MDESIQTVIDAIDALLNDASLESYTEDVVNRLASFGYTATAGDAYAIAFAMQKAYYHVLNTINDMKIPEGLKHIAIDMMCGEFLNVAYLTGRLELSGLDFAGVLQTVSEGDSSVTFATEGSDVVKFTSMVDWLISGRMGDMLCYRRIKW